jgi:hypothetical protein
MIHPPYPQVEMPNSLAAVILEIRRMTSLIDWCKKDGHDHEDYLDYLSQYQAELERQITIETLNQIYKGDTA